MVQQSNERKKESCVSTIMYPVYVEGEKTRRILACLQVRGRKLYKPICTSTRYKQTAKQRMQNFMPCLQPVPGIDNPTNLSAKCKGWKALRYIKKWDVEKRNFAEKWISFTSIQIITYNFTQLQKIDYRTQDENCILTDLWSQYGVFSFTIMQLHYSRKMMIRYH